MIPREILKKIRQIEIRTNRIVTETLAGQYHSVFKGQGMNFDEVREYQPGDDVRAIDWNVSARLGAPYIKTFTEQDGTLRYGVNGRLVVEVTGNGKTLTVNASCPGTVTVGPDHSVSVVFEGLTLSIPRTADAIWLFSGRVVFSSGAIVSHTGKTTDVCALLS